MNSSTFVNGQDFTVAGSGILTTTRNRSCASTGPSATCYDMSNSFFANTDGNLVVTISEPVEVLNPALGVTQQLGAVFPRLPPQDLPGTSRQ